VFRVVFQVRCFSVSARVESFVDLSMDAGRDG